MFWPFASFADSDPEAAKIMTLAKDQFTTSGELALGKLAVFLKNPESTSAEGEWKLHHNADFTWAKRWSDGKEEVRIDFATAINSGADSGSLYSDQRYLIQRNEQITQHIYLPSLRRVRIVSGHIADPLINSDYLVYDLTTIKDFEDYEYHFVDSNVEKPVIRGEKRGEITPYQSVIFILEKKAETYLVNEMTVLSGDQEVKHLYFSQFNQVGPARYRPDKIEILREGGKTEISLTHWSVRPVNAEFFSSTHLETHKLPSPLEASAR